ncbi:hypothetical protein GCM10023185_30950 [Hymenobacter saemangeumensis]|uniref:Uncharacterized protein n=1 Tax=Hymenobacter saemangeumensis TaxID=1084522 RepID=A0ABP8ILT8_9BACT
MNPTQEEYCPLWKRALRQVRRRIPFILAALLLLSYVKYAQLQRASQAAVAAQVSTGQLAADDDQVLDVVQSAVPPLGDTLGKSAIACGIFFGGLAMVWFIMSFVSPALPNWAQGTYNAEPGPEGQAVGDFKSNFLLLSPQWKFVVFLSVWLFLLYYWSLCWQAATLIK